MPKPSAESSAQPTPGARDHRVHAALRRQDAAGHRDDDPDGLQRRQRVARRQAEHDRHRRADAAPIALTTDTDESVAAL